VQIGKPEQLLSSRQKSLLERALRESLTNALKHAAPSRVEVRIVQQNLALELDVINDGPPASPTEWQEGHGLRGIRQRLAEFGGCLEILARPEGGAQVSIHLPIQAASRS